MPDGKRFKRKSREDVENKIISIQKQRRAEEKRIKPTADVIFDRWNDMRLEAGLAVGSTVLRDKSTWAQYTHGEYSEIGKISKRPICETKREEWTAYLQTILQDRPTAKEFSRIKCVVKGVLQYAEDMGEINFTATDVIDHVRIYKKSFSQKKKDPDTEVYYPDELEILKSYCLSHPNPYTRCIVAAIVLGERIGECAPLKIADVDLEG